jgi:hypothetical protein
VSVFSAVSVLDRDPDLGEDLGPEEFALARHQAVARVLRYPKGRWSAGQSAFDRAGALGLLVTEGLLVRKVTVGDRTCAELLGPGDVTQPWLRSGPDSSVGTEVNWQVAQPLTVALLDRGFAGRVARWPELPAAVARRLMLRVHWLSFHLAVCHMRRVDDRLLMVLWHFADRWGRVTPSGVHIDIALTHRLLALVVGARRPSVTASVRELIQSGRIEPQSGSRWVLHGDPPAELRELHEHAADHERPMPLELGGATTPDVPTSKRSRQLG